MIYLILLVTSRFANDVILIQVLQKKIPLWKIVIFIVIVLHGSVVVIKVQWAHCVPLNSEKCQD